MLLQINSGRKPQPTNEPHAFGGAVPAHEKMLLLAMLAVVAAWITFRVALMLLARIG